MINVRELLKSKGNQSFSISPDESVFNALSKMVENNVGSLLVTQEGKLLGLFTERDYVRKIVQEKYTSDKPVELFLNQNVLFVSPDTTIQDSMKLMTSERTRHLPVLENNEIVGIISIGDVIKAMIREKDSTIEQLEKGLEAYKIFLAAWGNDTGGG